MCERVCAHAREREREREEIVWACGMYGGRQKCVHDFGEDLNERALLERSGVDRKMLKGIVKRQDGRIWA